VPKNYTSRFTHIDVRGSGDTIEEMKVRSLLIALGMVASAVRAQDYDVWRACSISSVNMCTATGCSSRKPTISIYIGYHSDATGQRAVYLRCAVGFANCDRYDPVVRHIGKFVIFSLPERSVFSKLSTDNRLVDVAATNDVVFVARGFCVESAPPGRSQWRSGPGLTK